MARKTITTLEGNCRLSAALKSRTGKMPAPAVSAAFVAMEHAIAWFDRYLRTERLLG